VLSHDWRFAAVGQLLWQLYLISGQPSTCATVAHTNKEAQGEEKVELYFSETRQCWVGQADFHILEERSP
jgi:hypothetical protein